MKFFSIMVGGFFVLSTVALHAEEEKIIKFDALPPTVQRSILSHAKRAGVKKVELIYHEGLTKYEVETRNNGVSLDISLARNGEIVELEKTITPTVLSPAALTAIKKDYPGIQIHKVEAVQAFYYDVEGISAGNNIRFKVLATGDIEDEPSENQKGD